MAISGINPISSFNAVSTPLNEVNSNLGTGSSSVSFADMLKNALNNVNDLQVNADNLTNDLAAGKTDNIHEVLIAGEKASISLDLTMQIRNKVLDAYNEIMRMQI
jgi:flagellar hook-basal body complex protein FliE